MASERKLLSQLAPQLSEDTILRLVAAFQDLRRAYDAGTVTYPYSLRGELSCVLFLWDHTDAECRASKPCPTHASVPE